jgi:AbrB family looped-hinge helix DNA binding protein
VRPCCASSRNTRPKPPRMSTIQMHYDGWFTLPAAARQKFHLTTGDRLEVELAGDTIVLRPARGTAASGRAATAEPTPAAPEEPCRHGGAGDGRRPRPCPRARREARPGQAEEGAGRRGPAAAPQDPRPAQGRARRRGARPVASPKQAPRRVLPSRGDRRAATPRDRTPGPCPARSGRRGPPRPGTRGRAAVGRP